MDCVRNYLTSKEPCVHASQSCRDASFIVESTTDCVGDRAQIPDRNRAESWHEQHDRDEGVAKGTSDERAAAADPQVPTVRSSLCASRSSRTASVGDSQREEEEGCVASLGSRTQIGRARVGKECRSRRSPSHEKKKTQIIWRSDSNKNLLSLGGRPSA